MSSVTWIKKTVTEFTKAKETVRCERCGAGLWWSSEAIVNEPDGWDKSVRFFTEKHATCPPPPATAMATVETKIAHPSGQPFPVVGTVYAHSVIAGLVEAVGEELDDDEERDDMLDDGRLLRGVVEHRDHLHAQVGELQASNTAHITARRTAEAQLAGMNAYLDGKNLDANPYVEGDAAHDLWAKGWNDLRYPRLIRKWQRSDV